MMTENVRVTASREGWAGTRSAAQARLAEFMPEAPQYTSRRNFALPGNHGVSRLSPYLRHRLISEEEVITQVTSSHEIELVEKFIQEVVWRTYWKGALARTPEVWSSYEQQVAILSNDTSAKPLSDPYKAATEGNTHLPYFNDWVHELTSTGYLHNHIRMWFASIWIFTFKIPWQLGAAFMYEHLLDGDPASNTLSWRWVAGLHTKGKTYLARADNIAKYSEGRWTPRESELAPEPFAIKDDVAPTPYESLSLPPTSQSGPACLIVTTDDLSIETVLPPERYSAAVVYHPQAPRLTPLKRNFIEQGVADTVIRLRALLGNESVAAASSPSEAIEWITGRNVATTALVAPHVGPLSGPTRELARALTEIQHPVSLLQRSWDLTLFPLCDKGFFPMWERFKKRRASRGVLGGILPLFDL